MTQRTIVLGARKQQPIGLTLHGVPLKPEPILQYCGKWAMDDASPTILEDNYATKD